MHASVKEEIARWLRQQGVSGEIELTMPPQPELGDVCFACFDAAKVWKKSPADIAKTLAAKPVAGSKLIERIAAAGPYVNFFLNGERLVKTVVTAVLKDQANYGRTGQGKGKSVMIEYPSNNTHKEFHIGHFRNVCIGNAVVQLYRKAGYRVYPVNYLNDFGNHVARCLWGLRKFHANEQPPENKQKWLGEVYAEASRYLKDHPEAKPEVDAVQQKLEARDRDLWPLFMETRQWSIDRFEQLFKELGVEHEHLFCEKDVKSGGQKIVDKMLKKGIAEVGERGAIIIDLRPYHLDIALVRKADGAGLYLTSDLALAAEKFKRFNVNESIHVTGQEQIFYFKQLFKILELTGFKKKMTHIGYGLVALPEGKMSSRTGNVILYEDLRDEVYKKMSAETKNRHADWPERKLRDTAFKLSLAALKFDMQKHEAAKNIVFNEDEATAVEGFSGPYVLYVIARINSLAKKAGQIKKTGPIRRTAIRFQGADSPEEKKLALLIGGYEDIIGKALAGYNPSAVARYCFDLAQAFNDFYNHHSVLDAGDPELVGARLAVARATRQVLTDALGLLTIEPVEEM